MRIKIYFTIITAICFIFLSGCKSSDEKNNQKALDLMSVKTLGLAYLEEFKLEEARQEFEKFIDLAPKDKFGYANLGLTYLRMGKYGDAEKQLHKAVKIDSKDPDIRLLLSTVYEMDGKKDKAIKELTEALTFAPGHVKSLYDLSELYSSGDDPESVKQHEQCLLKLVEVAPGNIVPRLNLTDLYIRRGEADKAVEQLEIIRKQFPEFPGEAMNYYNLTFADLKKNDRENAILHFTVFHNFLKVTSPYQAGIMDLKGPGGSLIGFPLITFDEQAVLAFSEAKSIVDAITFTDATSSAGLDIVTYNAGNQIENKYKTHIVTSDYDGDGDIDIYAGSYDQSGSVYKHYLLNNDMGRYSDITAESGLNHSGNESSASFADYDNDGFMDLYIVREGGDLLYRNTGNGKFEDVTDKAGIGSKTGGNTALFFDMDHDGDLDMFETGATSNLMFRNNGDGTFTDQSEKLDKIPGNVISRKSAFGDFDEDEDIDLFVANENASDVLYLNQRMGVFKNGTEKSGLTSPGGSTSVAVGDYTNDGYLDILVTSANGGKHRLLKNNRTGAFETDNSVNELFALTKNAKINDVCFFDFDNDGSLDIFLAGDPTGSDTKGSFLFHNNGIDKFTDVSRLLPPDLKAARQVAVFDYNDDGDLDLLIAGTNGGITLLRNDGGNTNHFIKMKLVGLRAGSAKNNHFGIGAKVEIRSGDLYQTMVVTDPNIHFGIGHRAVADVIRITWTNGVPQNIFFPGTDQALIEAQTLKGSCPFLYTWDGDKFVFVKDILWRSALGMPLGIMGGTTAYAFADASDDYLKIPGEALKPVNGEYTLQVTSELWETIYLDQLQLVAVDHPDSVDVFVPEQFSPPPFPGFKPYVVGKKISPITAIGASGEDVMEFIRSKDDNYLSDFRSDKYQGTTEMHDLILDPGQISGSGHLYLFLNGWIFPTDASINYALSQTKSINVMPPVIQVINKKGEWQTVVDNLGFPQGKDKTVIADLSGKFLSSDHRIRIRTSMEIYWDYIFFSDRLSETPVVSTKMVALSADLHYRGFSRSFRKGGRYGPHWFDYSATERGTKWRDLPGNYTRYGDVLPLITTSDNMYIISNAGDEATIKFDEKILPALKHGWKRDFMVRSVGWVKDGDINTAYGNSVTPLPFHGMSSYPPSAKDKYPNDQALQKYNSEYNTRVVTNDGYLNALKIK
jgi:tetratricopeptide (TPR) repeat protein